MGPTLKKVLVTILLLLLAGIFAYLFTQKRDQSSEKGNGSTQNTFTMSPDQIEKKNMVESIANSAKQVDTIDITGCKPNPGIASFKVGSKITFVNKDSKPHYVAFDPTHIYAVAAKKSTIVDFFYFEKPGVRKYTCDTKPAGTIYIFN